jgi:hypothetical protein
MVRVQAGRGSIWCREPANSLTGVSPGTTTCGSLAEKHARQTLHLRHPLAPPVTLRDIWRTFVRITGAVEDVRAHGRPASRMQLRPLRCDGGKAAATRTRSRPHEKASLDCVKQPARTTPNSVQSGEWGKAREGSVSEPVGRTMVGCPPCRDPQKPACTSCASLSVPSVP